MEPGEEPSGGESDSWRQVDPSVRVLAVATVGAASITWWPAFTLGAYGTVFFQQLLTLWAASTAAFLVLTIFNKRRAVSWPRRLALLVPSVWLLVAFGLPTGTEPGAGRPLYWLALALTLAGGPYLAWALLRITLSGYDALTQRQRWAVFTIVAAIVVLGFALGRLNPYFLTCADFTISGNSQPPGCTPGPVSVR